MAKTTTMFIEHIINGFHFFLSLLLFVLIITGFQLIDLNTIQSFIMNGGLISHFIFLLPTIYTLGLLIDNVVDDKIFDRQEKKLRNKYITDQSQSGRKLIMLTKDDNQRRQLDYIRTKIRITRTASFNFGVLTSLSVLFTIIHLRGFLDGQVLLVVVLEVIVGGLLTYLAYWSWKSNTKTYCKRVVDGFKLLELKHHQQEPAQIAAEDETDNYNFFNA
ncbi:hypothetical protein SAMN05192534_11182 [Alteribacillus persepolensis]|uniref:Uncharacterized protein n=1 Tax=Alteribacillus persepolensis TaxID=568899 RepID=A0A1G8F818_9BACI|nr:hypothetical protein [Alteribacillus persepolensis]SDH78261.1 hypothetical protein SAMN05192534_11182 [Alteribacillus persepolensis]